MYRPNYTGQFNRDIRKLEQSGRHDIEKLKVVIRRLLKGEPLESRHRDHKLTGDYERHRDCHIEPDWILIYRIDKRAQVITFTRTGSHTELFE